MTYIHTAIDNIFVDNCMFSYFCLHS